MVDKTKAGKELTNNKTQVNFLEAVDRIIEANREKGFKGLVSWKLIPALKRAGEKGLVADFDKILAMKHETKYGKYQGVEAALGIAVAAKQLQMRPIKNGVIYYVAGSLTSKASTKEADEALTKAGF